MKNTLKTTTLLFTALIFLNISCTKKSTAPSGANVVRMTLDGVNYETSGNSSSFGIEGIVNGLNNYHRSFAGHFSSKLDININDIPKVSTVGIYNLMQPTDSMTKTIYISRKNSKGQAIGFINTLNSGSVNITDNNTNFISGTFNCTLYQDTTWLNDYDSTSPAKLTITNGYFDIPVK